MSSSGHADRDHHGDSPGSNSPTTSTLHREHESRRTSFGTVNGYTYCGRHSKEFLCNGKGFRDLWRAVTKK
ncbi:hypothetical protein VTH82DRAFT_1004 [Thermothelomyces myriococcoides]